MLYRRDADGDYEFESTPQRDMEDNSRGVLTLRTTDKKSEITLQEAAVSVSGKNGVVKTPLTGIAGTVKEYTDQGDFTVTITGAFTGEYSQYPENEIETLINILSRADSVEVESEHLKMFGITNLAVESYTVNQEKGFVNRQAFTINAVSDTPFEIEYNDEKDSL
jgi:hypothetical protein